MQNILLYNSEEEKVYLNINGEKSVFLTGSMPNQNGGGFFGRNAWAGVVDYMTEDGFSEIIGEPEARDDFAFAPTELEETD